MQALKLTTRDVESWSRVGEHEIFVSDLVDKPTEPEAKMTVGYARVGAEMVYVANPPAVYDAHGAAAAG